MIRLEPYNDDYSKITMHDGVEEFVEQGAANWLTKQPESNWRRWIDGFQSGVNTSLFDNTLEGRALLRSTMKGDIYDQPEDAVTNPILSPEEQKEQYGLDATENRTLAQTIIDAETKQVQQEMQADVGQHFGWDRPIESVFTFAGMALGASVTPTAIASGAVVGAVLPGLGHALGAVGKGTINAIVKTRALTKIGRTVKSTPAAKALSNYASNPGLAKAVDITAKTITKPISKIAAKPSTKAFVHGSLAAGGGNALEEVVLYYENQSHGHQTDLASAVAMGAFAPAVLRGSLSAVGYPVGKSFKFAKNLTTIIDADKVIDSGTFKIGFELQNARPELTSAINKVDKIGSVTELKENLKAELDRVDNNSKPAIREELKHIEAIEEGHKVFGEKAFNDFLINLVHDIDKSGFKVNIKELFPFLRNKEAFRKHLSDVKKNFNMAKNARFTPNHLEGVFTMTPIKFDEYISNFAKTSDAPAIKRTDVVDEPAVSYDKMLQERVENIKQSDNAIDQAFGRRADEVDEAVNEYVRCVAGVVDGE